MRSLARGPSGLASRGLAERPLPALAPVTPAARRAGSAAVVAAPRVCALPAVCRAPSGPALARRAGRALAGRACGVREGLSPPAASPSPAPATEEDREGWVQDADTGAVDLARDGEAALAALPDAPGVYGVFSREGVLQYVGMSRRLRASVAAHARNGCRDEMGLVEFWQVWGKPGCKGGGEGGCGGSHSCGGEGGCSKKNPEEEANEAGGEGDGAGANEAGGEGDGAGASEAGVGAVASEAASSPARSSPAASSSASARSPDRPLATTEELTAAWRLWIERAIQAEGHIPPGNVRGSAEAAKWAVRRHGRELRLTPGKGADKLTVPIDVLLADVLRSEAHPLVAFIKGTPAAPQCGFSARAVLALERACARAGRDARYDAVDVLDERFNPGVREAIKRIGGWPTLPQVYLNGELLGGSNILEQLEATGELQRQVKEHFDKSKKNAGAK